MRMILRYHNGIRVQAALLAVNHDMARATIEFQDDCIELRRTDDSWRTEDGEAIEIEALIQVPDTDASRFCEAMRPRTMTAGSSSGPFTW